MKYHIQRYKESITIADSGTVGNSGALTLNGLVRGILLDIPSLTSNANTVVTIILLDGAEEFTLYTSGNQAHNGNRAILFDGQTQPNPLQVPITTNCKVRLTASDAQTGAKVIPVYLLLERQR